MKVLLFIFFLTFIASDCPAPFRVFSVFRVAEFKPFAPLPLCVFAPLRLVCCGLKKFVFIDVDSP
jgi:hypothetical protein